MKKQQQINPLKGKVITVDGPSASGKGTLAKNLAKQYRMKYLDTGTIYRAVTYLALEAGLNLDDENALVNIAKDLPENFDFKHIGNNQFGVFVYGKNITPYLHLPRINAVVSNVAVYPKVRKKLFDFQVSFVEKWKDIYGVLIDGRDCGARIWPKAEVKLFLVADVKVRAKRRYNQLLEAGVETPFEDVLKHLIDRDKGDAHNTIQTDDAVVLDVTKCTIVEVMLQAMKAIERRVE